MTLHDEHQLCKTTSETELYLQRRARGFYIKNCAGLYIYIYKGNIKISATVWYLQTLLQLFCNQFHAFTTAVFRRMNSSFPTPLFIAYFLLVKRHMALLSKMFYTVLHID